MKTRKPKGDGMTRRRLASMIRMHRVTIRAVRSQAVVIESLVEWVALAQNMFPALVQLTQERERRIEMLKDAVLREKQPLRPQ